MCPAKFLCVVVAGNAMTTARAFDVVVWGALLAATLCKSPCLRHCLRAAGRSARKAVGFFAICQARRLISQPGMLAKAVLLGGVPCLWRPAGLRWCHLVLVSGGIRVDTLWRIAEQPQ